MKYKGIELYEENGKYAVLVSGEYGAGWSTWNRPELAYDKRVVQFFLDHKDDAYFMGTVCYNGFEAYIEAKRFFSNLGYEEVYMGGFPTIYVEWVSENDIWRINEYDGLESLEMLSDAGFVCFGGE